ncbi:DivIVA domain-containing protein [Fibrobacterales bacterium]|nr:DivIVA domain-containing protein [Fibrobacterales bacterium]
MELTPLDIRNQKFASKKLGGYDPEEVQQFLEQTAAAFEKLIEERADLLRTISNDKNTVEQYKHLEETLKGALITMQRVLDETKTRANKEADLIIAEAKAKAEREAQTIRNQANDLRLEIDRLKQVQVSYFSRLRNLMRTQEDLLNNMENEDDV